MNKLNETDLSDILIDLKFQSDTIDDTIINLEYKLFTLKQQFLKLNKLINCISLSVSVSGPTKTIQ